MEFKNDQFEKNAAKTLQTLQELKQKLNNNFSTKGAEELNRAIKSVDVSPISQGLETVQLKFNALQIAGKRVIENIVDAAMNAVHQVTSKLTGVINQIKVGGANRAQNIENAKFMLSGLGIEWKDIVDDINYGVQDTAYGLDAAAKVASQLVASNVTLGKDMQSSLRAVSGVAAMTNSTYEEIGHIFTSVAGQGKLMTMQLQQFSLRGLNVAADLAKYMNTTEAEIRDMVTKGKIDFMTFAKAMDELYGEHAKEANKTFSGALSNTKAALSRLGADIQSQKFESFRIILLEVTTQLKDFKKAIKPAEDAIIEMMAAVGNLVANFVKTANLKTIAEKLVPPIKKAAEYVRDFANAWRELREEATPVNTIAEYVQKLKGGMEETTEATDEALTSIEKLAKASDKDLKRYAENAWAIWNEGKFGNGQDRINALGEDYELTQEYVDKMIELGWDEAKMNEYLNEQREKATKQEARQQTVNRLKTTVAKVLNIFTNLKTVLHNVTSSVVNVLKATFSGLSEAISGKGSGFLDALIFLTGKLADFTSKIAITKERAEKIRPIAKAIGDILIYIGKGIYNCIKFLITLIGKASESKIIKGIFEAIGKAINAIFEGLKKIYTKMKESGAWDKFIDILKTIGTWLGERLIDGFNLLGDVASSIGEALGDIFSKVVGKITELRDKSKDGHGWLSKIGDFFKEDILSGSWLTKLKDTLNDIFGTGKDVFQNAYTKMSDFMSGLVAGIKSIGVTDLDSAIHVIGQIALIFTTAKWLWSMSTLNKRISDGFKNLDKLFGALKSTVRKYGRKADTEAFESFAKSVAIIVGSFLAILFSFAYLKAKGIDYVPMAKEAGKMVLLYTVIIGVLVILKTLAKKAEYVTGTTVSAFGKVKIPAFAATMAAIAYLLKTLIESFVTMYDIVNSPNYDSKRVTAVTLNIGLLLVGLMFFAAAISKVDKTLVGLSGAGFMIISMAVLFKAVISSFKKVLKLVKDADSKDIKQATSTINWLIIPIMAFGAAIIFLTRKFPTNSTTQANPFKGIIWMFVGLAALLRLGFVPLLKTLAELRGMGEAGISAIADFKNITRWLIVFIGILATVLTVFSNFKYEGRNVGSAALGQSKMSGGFSTGGNNGLFYGVMSVILGIAAMFAALAYVMKNMKGVDSHSIARFKEMVEVIIIVVSLLSVIMAAVGAVDQTKGVPLALAAVAGLFIGVAAVMAAMGYAIKSFTESLIELVDYLPIGLKKLEEFFELIEDYDVKDNALGGHSRGGNSIRSKLIKGIADTASLLKEGFWAALIGWTEPNKDGIAQVVENLFTSAIIALNSLADTFSKQGPELIDAADRLAIAFGKFMLLVLAKIKERTKGMKQSVGEAAARAFLPESLADEVFGVKTEGEINNLVDSTVETWEEADKELKDRLSKAVKSYGPQPFSLNDGSEALPALFTTETENQVNDIIDKTLDKVAKSDTVKNFKNQLMQKVLSGQFTPSQIQNVFTSGDLSKLNLNIDTDKLLQEAGIDDISNIDVNSLLGLDNINFDLESSEGIEGFQEYLDSIGAEFEIAGEDNANAYTEALQERMEFVTDITDEAGDAAVDRLKKFDSKFYDAGKFCAQGFADGLLDKYAVQRVKQNSYELVDISEKAIQTRADEHSPSKVFMKLGQFITVGFANGIIDAVTTASGAANEVGEATILSMRETIKRASFEAVEGIDNPRITPILDLSNVAEGVGEMRGLFDTAPAYKLAMATSGEARAATRTRIAAIYQNGSNYDDTNAIGAINSLNSEVATLKDAINGMQVVIDGKALVGQIATPMDKALGKMAIAGRRGI